MVLLTSNLGAQFVLLASDDSGPHLQFVLSVSFLTAEELDSLVLTTPS